MAQSESITKLVTALAKAQSEITSPARNREVTVTPRSGGGSYKFSYTTLDELIDHVRVPLTKNGLWFVQTTRVGEPGNFILCTKLFHESGEWLDGEISVTDPGTHQQLGSSLTYHRRYALAGILGIASDMDDDANGADGNSIDSSRDRPTPPRSAPAPIKTTVKEDPAKKAAINFAQVASQDIMDCKTMTALQAWKMIKDPKHGTTNVDKIEKLKVYDKELYDQVMLELREAEAKLIGT